MTQADCDLISAGTLTDEVTLASHLACFTNDGQVAVSFSRCYLDSLHSPSSALSAILVTDDTRDNGPPIVS